MNPATSTGAPSATPDTQPRPTSTPASTPATGPATTPPAAGGAVPAAAGTPPAAAPRGRHAPRRGRWLRPVLLVLVPLAAAAGAAVFYLQGGHGVETDNAYLKADKLAVSADIAGTVAEVLVQDNQAVAAGTPLFRLDATPFQVAAARAQARLAQVRQDHAETLASYREKQAEVALARSRHAFALREQQRMADLVARQFVSAAKFDEARQAAEVAERQVQALELGLQRIAMALGGGPEAAPERLPGYQAAQADLEQARLNLAHTEVRAPLPGVVSRPPRPGQYLAAGAGAMALVGNGALWVEANFPETELTHVQPGQRVTIRIDTYPDRRWLGVVDSLSPATGAEFSVIPAQNATGNWVRIAQRVPVRIRIETPADAPPLRAGLSAHVAIETGQRRQLLGFSL